MKIRILLGALLIMSAVVATGCVDQVEAASEATVSQPEPTVEKRAEAWADSVMATLSIDERVAQLFMPRVDLTSSERGRAEVRRMVKTYQLGGLLMGKGTLVDYADIINAAQAEARVPLMISLDGEWGLAMRVTDAPRFPYNMGLGAIQNPQLLYEYGREVGRECRAVGINVDFAPVMDVNSNPANPVIGYRSYGEDPERVAALGVAFSQGLESEGVMSVAKHFPGHGDTSTDSHKTLPTVAHSRSMLERIDLLPFERYIKAGLGGVMVGHLKVPALDGSGTPASLSKKITSDLLRRQMGFTGLIFTDALAMKGAVGGKTNNCVAALLAGADVILEPGNLKTDLQAVRDAVKSGKISKKIIDDRCHRVLYYKYLLGLSDFTPADVANVKKIVNAEPAAAIIDKLADASVTVIFNRDNLLPLRDLGHRRVAVVTIGATKDNLFALTCGRYAQVDVVSVAKGTHITQSQINRLREDDVVIAGIMTSDAAARESFGRLEELENLVPVFFINPYKMDIFGPKLGRLATLVTAYDNQPALQQAAAEAVFGGIDVTGRLPVNLANVTAMGAGVDVPKVRLGYSSPSVVGLSPLLPQRIDSIAEAAIAAGAMTGCQVLVAKDGNVIFEKAYGRIDEGRKSTPVTINTLFDIASMTKTNATTAGLMKAIDEGVVSLDDPLSKFIPALDSTDKADITIRNLLFHESGIPAAINIYRLVTDADSYEGGLYSKSHTPPYTIKISRDEWGNQDARLRSDIYGGEETDSTPFAVADGIYVGQDGIDEILRKVYSAPLRSNSYEYSDLNFVLLKEVIETATGVDLDQWVDTEIYGPLGAWHTLYQPLQRFDTDDIAATEQDNFLRRQKIHGYAHDETAAFSGGVSGNAGLFSTAGDVAKFCQMLLCDGAYGGDRIISRPTARQFRTERSRSGRRGLGFDLLRFYSSMAADASSANTFGHTGFTGTCFWVDPESNLIYVFLSNRVNPSRDNPAWNRLNPRGEILRAIYQQ